MRIAILLLISVSLLVSGCATKVDVYTFKKDRVDQKINEDNVGYLSGKPNNLQGTDRNVKRTLIGIDVDLSDDDMASGSVEQSDTAESSASSVTQNQTTKDDTYVYKPKTSKPVTTTTTTTTSSQEDKIITKGGVETIVVEKETVETEADWIK